MEENGLKKNYNYLKQDTLLKDKITCVILTLNEERYIAQCIDSILECSDEIVIIDTGSIDNTILIAKKFKTNKISIYKYDWNNNFADARNYAISKVKSGWIFFVDADEVLDVAIDYESLHKFIKQYNNDKDLHKIVISPLIIDAGTDQCYKDVPRIFYKSNYLYYFGAVHEEIRCIEGQVIHYNEDIILHHYGYLKNNIIDKNKINRNLELLRKMLYIEPNYERWIYMYVKDGYGVIEDSILEEKIKNVILKDTKELTLQKININKYTFGLLDILCKLNLKNEKFDEVIIIADLMNDLLPNNTNSFYYKTVSNYLLLKDQIKKLLLKTITYRKNNFEMQEGMISTEGYHIDYLISILLFEVGDYQRAIKYFEHLNGKLYDEKMLEIITQLKKIAKSF